MKPCSEMISRRSVPVIASDPRVKEPGGKQSRIVGRPTILDCFGKPALLAMTAGVEPMFITRYGR